MKQYSSWRWYIQRTIWWTFLKMIKTSLVLERCSCPLAARILQKLMVTGFPQSFLSCNSTIWKTRLVSLMPPFCSDPNSGFSVRIPQVPGPRLLVDLRDKQQLGEFEQTLHLQMQIKSHIFYIRMFWGGFPSAFQLACTSMFLYET